jgi:hypothetical protein
MCESRAKAEAEVDAMLAWRDFIVSNYSDADQQRVHRLNRQGDWRFIAVDSYCNCSTGRR